MVTFILVPFWLKDEGTGSPCGDFAMFLELVILVALLTGILIGCAGDQLAPRPPKAKKRWYLE